MTKHIGEFAIPAKLRKAGVAVTFERNSGVEVTKAREKWAPWIAKFGVYQCGFPFLLTTRWRAYDGSIGFHVAVAEEAGDVQFQSDDFSLWLKQLDSSRHVEAKGPRSSNETDSGERVGIGAVSTERTAEDNSEGMGEGVAMDRVAALNAPIIDEAEERPTSAIKETGESEKEAERLQDADPLQKLDRQPQIRVLERKPGGGSPKSPDSLRPVSGTQPMPSGDEEEARRSRPKPALPARDWRGALPPDLLPKHTLQATKAVGRHIEDMVEEVTPVLAIETNLGRFIVLESSIAVSLEIGAALDRYEVGPTSSNGLKLVDVVLVPEVAPFYLEARSGSE